MVPIDQHFEAHPTPFGGERTAAAKASVVYRRSRAGIALPSVLGALAVLASAMHAGCVLFALVTPFWTGPRLLQGDIAIVPGYDEAYALQQQQQEQHATNLSMWVASSTAAITSTAPHTPPATTITTTTAVGPYERRLMLPVTELLVSPYYYCINVHQPPDEVAWWVNVQASAATRTINEEGHLVLELNGAFIPERHALLCELRSDHRLRVDSRFEETYYDLAVHSDDSFNGTGSGKDCRRTAKEQRYLAAIVRGVVITSGLLSALSVTVGVALVALLQISSRKELHHRRRGAVACCRPSGGVGALLLRIAMLLFSALAVAASIGGLGATIAAYSPDCSEDAPCQFLYSIAHRLGREGNYSQSVLDAIEVAAAGIGGTVTDGRGVNNINASALPVLQCEVGVRSSACVYYGAIFFAFVSAATTLFSLIVAVWAAHAPPVAVALNTTYHDRERRHPHRHQEVTRDASSRAVYAGAVQNEIAAHTRSLSVSEYESSDSGSSDGAFYQEEEEDNDEEEMEEMEAQPLSPRDNVTLSTRSIVQAGPPAAANNGRTNSVRPRPTVATTAGPYDTSHTHGTSSGHRRSTAAPPESLSQPQPPQSPVGDASTAPRSSRQSQRARGGQGTTDLATRGDSHHPRAAGDDRKTKPSPTTHHVSVGADLLSTAPPLINNATVRTAVITMHPKSAHHAIRSAPPPPAGHHAGLVPHSAPVRGGRWKVREEVGSAGDEPSQQVLSPSTPAATSSASASGGGANGPSTSSSNHSSARNHKHGNELTQEDRKGNSHSAGTHRPRANNASPHGTQESGMGAGLQQQQLSLPVVTFEPPAGGDWEWDSNSNMYWSDAEYLFLNPASGHFYDPNSRQWFNPDSGAWYAEICDEDPDGSAQHAHNRIDNCLA